jgi:hypothetical protein
MALSAGNCITCHLVINTNNRMWVVYSPQELLVHWQLDYKNTQQARTIQSVGFVRIKKGRKQRKVVNSNERTMRIEVRCTLEIGATP